MYSVWVLDEARQFSLGRLHHGETGHLLLEKTILDRVKEYEKVEVILVRVVMVDTRLSNRPRPIRRSVILFSVSDLVRDFL